MSNDSNNAALFSVSTHSARFELSRFLSHAAELKTVDGFSRRRGKGELCAHHAFPIDKRRKPIEAGNEKCDA